MRIFLRRRSISLLLMVIFTLCLSGCTDDGKITLDPKNPVSIAIWHYYHGAQKTAFDDAVKEFNETLGLEKGIIVEAISHGGVGELAANVIAAASGELDAGEMPNIFGSYGDTALEILNLGKAVDIDSYLTAEELAEYEDSFIHEGKIGTDKVYVFPIAKSTESLMLNKTDFDAFVAHAADAGETVGYDDLATWEGILRVSGIYFCTTDLMTPDVVNDGKAFFGLDSLANYIIVGSKQLGQNIVEVKNKSVTVNLDAEIMKKLWYTYYEPTVTGRFTKLGAFCSDDIKTGDSLGYIGSTSSASYFPTELTFENGETKDIELMVLPMPVFEGGAKTAIQQGAGMVIVKSEKEKEYASAAFLKWFTEAERNVSFSLSSSYLPVKKKALDDKLLSEAFAAINDDGTQNAVKALNIGIEQLRQYTMYSCEIFDGGVDFRYTLPRVLEETAANNRAAYLEMLNNGSSPEEAYGELYALSGAKFDEWINSLKE